MTKATATAIIPPEKPGIDNTSNKINLGDLFAPRGRYLNELTLFVAHFNAIPNLISEIAIDCKRANRWFEKQYPSEIKKKYFIKRYFDGSKNSEYDDIFYILYEDLLVNFDTNCSTVRFLFAETELPRVEAVARAIKRFKKRTRRQAFIYLLMRSSAGFETKALELNRPKLRIEDHYNDDFIDVHRRILNRLQQPKDKGLVLLHGKPGTGKTSYIRHLAASLRKKVIFLPPSLTNALTNPDLISVLTDNPDSVFVIEDAENIIVDRETAGNSPVSTLLNITDGLLSDCLTIQLICSFNTDLSRVDRALLRKGRLIASYEFKELETAKARALSATLGFETQIHSPMTLTAVYNQEEPEFCRERKTQAIGFGSKKGY
ncbi:AAA family ATPase [Cyclobacterium xiamenense]|uniref:AAA family ATPase n=1 Tax=Cyclobacterium xiamenense TaxID=1297121 RepID=UPI0012B999B6|nr:AAA family ATPase [Cyclobacterium xiamenense]